MDRKITALQAQKRNPNRVSVYLDGQFAFGLSRIVAAWLKVGQSLSEEKIAALQAQETQEKAFQKALALLSHRPRSEAEIHQKLDQAGFDAETIQSVLERLRQAGLVEDRSFAQGWIESRSTFRPRSRSYLAFELRRKGVDDEIIKSTLAQAAEDDQLALQAAQHYARRLTHLDWAEFEKKLSAFLGRRGFSFSIIRPVVRQVWQESQEK